MVLSVVGLFGATALAPARASQTSSSLGRTVKVSTRAYPVVVAGGHIVMGTNDDARSILIYDKQGEHRSIRVPGQNGVLGATDTVAWIRSPTTGRMAVLDALVEQVDLKTGELLGTVDLRTLDPEIFDPINSVIASDRRAVVADLGRDRREELPDPG